MTLTKTAMIRQKNDNVLMSTAGPADWFGKIWIAQKQGLPIVNILHWNGSSSGEKKRREIDAPITMPPRLRLSTLDNCS
jgi:hypothetical protein